MFLQYLCHYMGKLPVTHKWRDNKFVVFDVINPKFVQNTKYCRLWTFKVIHINYTFLECMWKKNQFMVSNFTHTHTHPPKKKYLKKWIFEFQPKMWIFGWTFFRQHNQVMFWQKLIEIISRQLIVLDFFPSVFFFQKSMLFCSISEIHMFLFLFLFFFLK